MRVETKEYDEQRNVKSDEMKIMSLRYDRQIWKLLEDIKDGISDWIELGDYCPATSGGSLCHRLLEISVQRLGIPESCRVIGIGVLA